MSTLLLVRHAQASFFADDYDQLSPLGETQARLLGEYLAHRKITFDAVYVGPAKRHVRTVELAGEAYRAAGLAWPTPQPLVELAEHDADKLVYSAHELTCADDPRLGPLITDFQRMRASGQKDAELQRGFQRLFEALVALWSDGRLEQKLVEPWPQFQSRVLAGVERMLSADSTGGRKVAAFTSVGPITIAIQRALAGTHAQAHALGWRLRNCSLTSFLYSPGRFSLDQFNSLPHLDREELVTYR